MDLDSCALIFSLRVKQFEHGGSVSRNTLEYLVVSPPHLPGVAGRLLHRVALRLPAALHSLHRPAQGSERGDLEGGATAADCHRIHAADEAVLRRINSLEVPFDFYTNHHNK